MAKFLKGPFPDLLDVKELIPHMSDNSIRLSSSILMEMEENVLPWKGEGVKYLPKYYSEVWLKVKSFTVIIAENLLRFWFSILQAEHWFSRQRPYQHLSRGHGNFTRGAHRTIVSYHYILFKQSSQGIQICANHFYFFN